MNEMRVLFEGIALPCKIVFPQGLVTTDQMSPIFLVYFNIGSAKINWLVLAIASTNPWSNS